MPLSSWLFSEMPPRSGEPFTVEVSGGSGPENVIPADASFYFHDDDASISWLSHIQARILSNNLEVLACVVILQENRLVRITFADPTDIVWGTATDIRDALGFEADCTGSDSYTATLVSPYLWCPGLTEVSRGRLGRQGVPIYDTQMGGGGSFTKPVVTTSNFRVNNTLSWNSVINTLAEGRVWAMSEPDDMVGGEYFCFWHSVLLAGLQFTHYRATENDEASTDVLVLSSSNRMGPYCWAVRNGDVEFPYSRTIENVEARSDVSIPVTQVSDL